MAKAKKADVQFVLPEPELLLDGDEADEYLDPPYTSVLMSTASGDGCTRSTHPP